MLTCNGPAPCPKRGAGWPLCRGASWLEVEAAVEAARCCAGNSDRSQTRVNVGALDLLD